MRPRNRGKNREVFEFGPEIVEFCPEFVNFARRQGINREFCGYLRNAIGIKHLSPLFAGFRKLSGNEQGILPSPVVDAVLPSRNFHAAGQSTAKFILEA